MLGTKTALAWCVVVVILCGLSCYQIIYHWKLQTDVLALLPDTERDPATAALRQIASGNLGRTVLFVVGHSQESAAREATRLLGEKLAASPLFVTVHWDHSRTQQAFFDLYFPFRYHLLSPSLRHDLNVPDGHLALIQRLKQLLYQPTSSLLTRFLEADPLLFFPALTQDWQPPKRKLHMQDGLLTAHHNGRWYHVITAQLALDPFATATQEQFDAQWETWVSSLQQTWPGIDIIGTSAVRFAAATQKTIVRDIAIISIGSLLGITILILGTFQTGRHLILALLPIVIGIWSAIGITLWLFGDLHTVTLTFGASLVGICDDYSFHYFTYHRLTTPWHAQRTMRHLLLALSLGAFTTILSFLGLAFTPLVGLQQIAVFASCGVLVAFATVILWFPYLLNETHPRAQHPPALYFATLNAFAFGNRYRKPLLIVYGLVLLLCLPGLWLLHVSDSPRALNALPKDLQEQDQFIRTIMGLSQNQTHLIVKGHTAEDALQKLEQLTAPLVDQPARPSVELGPVITSFLPSMKQQKANLLTVQRLLDQRPFLAQELGQLGFTEEVIQQFFHTIAAPPETFLTPELWQQHEASRGLRHLWLGDPSSPTSSTSLLVQVFHIHDPYAFAALLDKSEGIHYVDPVADFTRVFKHYRRQAAWLVSGAYVLIFAILVWSYKARSVIIMLPPVLAALVTISVFGWLGHPFHLIHLLMLLLVLGMGIDFTIFIAEGSLAEGPTTLLALTLSALSTVLSFGLLSLSGQAVLQAIGLTVLIGIAGALFFAPLAYYGRSSL
ncbi:MAG: hypothetical protein FJ147_01930 [Deltaproteobacteria bacterium]|nr:hypothetical protein [Deltaproteobacteria bacterium]